MKNLLAIFIVAIFASSAMAADKTKAANKPAAVKKEVKHHKKFEGTEIAGTKPDTVAPKKKK
jgi:hypothetical protein